MSYQIRIANVLDQSWSEWLGSGNIFFEQMEDKSMVTTLTIDSNDLAQLFGVLDHIRDLNIRLISVTHMDE